MTAAVSALLSFCIGCAAHRPLAPAYKLAEIDSQYFLVSASPLATEQRQRFEITLGGGPSNQQFEGPSNCSVRGQWFALDSVASTPVSRWVVETPSADAWAKIAGHIDLKLEWDRFLQEISDLQKKHCFPAFADFGVVKQKIVEGMSMPAEDALLYRYSYGQAGYVDLTPSMELRIERNLAVSGGETKRGSSPLRTITTSYGFSSLGTNQVRIHLLRVQDTAKGHDTLQLPDAGLASKYEAVPHLRLILQRLDVSADAKSPAILLGGSDIGSLDKGAQAAVNDRRMSCDQLARFQVRCVAFDGLVTVSPVLSIKVNGHARYVPLGSKTSYVFPPAPGFELPTLKTLRIRRQFEGGYRELEFNHDDQDVGQILLFGGDEISFTRPARH